MNPGPHGVYIQINPQYNNMYRALATSVFAELAGINLGFGVTQVIPEESRGMELQMHLSPSHFVQEALAHHMKRIVAWTLNPRLAEKLTWAKSSSELGSLLAQGVDGVWFSGETLIKFLAEWYGDSAAISVTNRQINREREDQRVTQIDTLLKSALLDGVEDEPRSAKEESRVLRALNKAFGCKFTILNPSLKSKFQAFEPNHAWCSYEHRRRQSGVVHTVEEKLAMLPLPSDRPVEEGAESSSSNTSISVLLPLCVLPSAETTVSADEIKHGDTTTVCVVRTGRDIYAARPEMKQWVHGTTQNPAKRYNGSSAFAAWMHIESFAYNRKFHEQSVRSMLHAITEHNARVSEKYLCDCLDMAFPSDPEDERDLMLATYLSERAGPTVLMDSEGYISAHNSTDGETDVNADSQKRVVYPGLLPVHSMYPMQLDMPGSLYSTQPALNACFFAGRYHEKGEYTQLLYTLNAFFGNYGLYVDDSRCWLAPRKSADERVREQHWEAIAELTRGNESGQRHTDDITFVPSHSNLLHRDVADTMGKPFVAIHFEQRHFIVLALTGGEDGTRARSAVLSLLDLASRRTEAFGVDAEDSIHALRNVCTDPWFFPSDPHTSHATLFFRPNAWVKHARQYCSELMISIRKYQGIWAANDPDRSRPVSCVGSRTRYTKTGRVSETYAADNAEEYVFVGDRAKMEDPDNTEAPTPGWVGRDDPINYHTEFSYVTGACSDPEPSVGLVMVPMQLNTFLACSNAQSVHGLVSLAPPDQADTIANYVEHVRTEKIRNTD